MLNQDTIEVLRECHALLIPSGDKVTLQKGSLVVITQALGNSYTVYVNGNLARVSGADGDALGMVILAEPNLNEMAGPLEDKIWATLKTCFDPEIPVNIVDLGLVYECNLFPQTEGLQNVVIVMTLTAPACGMGPVLVADIEQKLKGLQGLKEITVNLVFDPPWSRNMMSDVAKLQLGML